MIREIRLQNWRAYEELTLELGPGATFVVASNGVGKTSLILALGWGIYGEQSGVEARSCIRVGAQEAKVEVDLLLQGDRILSIERGISRRGRARVKGMVDGAVLSEAEITSELEREFSVSLGIASRLSMMMGGGSMISERALELESHLYEAFGVAELLATAKTAETLAREAERTRKALHAATKEHLEDRASKEAELAKLIPRLEHLEEDRARVRHRAELAEGALREAHEAKARAAEKERYENRVAALLAEAHALRVSDLEDVGESLDHAKASFAVWLTRARERVERDEGLLAESQGRVGLARAALNQLDGHIARCPVCLRDLGEAELARSRDLQSEALRDATASLSELQQSLAALQGDVASVSALLSQLASLSPPAAQATPAIEVTTAQHERTEALDALEKHHQEQGALRSRVESLQRELAEDDANAERERELVVAYRREAIARTTADALQEAAESATELLIQPIADEVRKRWQLLFGGEGLRLRPDGSIVRVVAAEEIGWSAMSGGERVWARVLTHLLVVASSTRLPFIWFDEPLEHLDPALRRSVATTLATAGSAGHVEQLLVTTYENTLARQLAEDTERVALVNVRASIDERAWFGNRPPEYKPSTSAESRAS